MTYRSSSLNYALRFCPYALDLWERGTPHDKGGFQQGISAHAVAQEFTNRARYGEFAIAVRALADNGRGLRALVSAQFEHVIDKTMGDPKNDPAHPFTNSGPPIYRC